MEASKVIARKQWSGVRKAVFNPVSSAQNVAMCKEEALGLYRRTERPNKRGETLPSEVSFSVTVVFFGVVAVQVWCRCVPLSVLANPHSVRGTGER